MVNNRTEAVQRELKRELLRIFSMAGGQEIGRRFPTRVKIAARRISAVVA